MKIVRNKIVLCEQCRKAIRHKKDFYEYVTFDIPYHRYRGWCSKECHLEAARLIAYA